MSNLNTTIIDIFNDWFLKQHGLLPEQAIQRIAELEAENKLLDEIAELPRYVCEMHEINKIGAALRYRDVLKVLKQREQTDE